MKNSKNCLGCIFHETVAGPTKEIAIVCRRHAPRMASQPIQNTQGQVAWIHTIQWPIVNADDWCGEFQTEAASLRVVS